MVRTLFDEGDASHGATASFFVSYVILVGIVLFNIIIAVLLDAFLESIEDEKLAIRRKEQEILHHTHAGPIDPLLAEMVDFKNFEDLSSKILKLYKMLDADNDGDLSYAEVKEGLAKIETKPKMQLSKEDFEAMTEGLCDPKGCISSSQFDNIIRKQLRDYAQVSLPSAASE